MGIMKKSEQIAGSLRVETCKPWIQSWKGMAVGIAILGTGCGGAGGGAPPGTAYGLNVSPSPAANVSLNEAGTLSPPTHLYTVTNGVPDESRYYEVASTAPWIQVSGTDSETLTPGDESSFIVAFDSAMLGALGAGVHEGTVRISDPSSTEFGAVTRTVRVSVAEPGTTPDDNRVTAGLLVRYDFNEGSGTTVNDTSGVGVPLNLEIASASAVTWQPGTLVVGGGSEVISPGAATKINDACKINDEITIEAWVTPNNVAQDGPARVVTLSDGSLLRNVTLGHGGSGSEPMTAYNVRLRTSTSTDNGIPALITAANEIPAAKHHVVYTRRADGVVTVYVDGTVSTSTAGSGDLSNWNSNYRLSLGNEVGASRAWVGGLHLVAIYDRSLAPAEVTQNFQAGSVDGHEVSVVVTPASDLVAFGITGTDIGEQFKMFEVHNNGDDPVSWEVTSSAPWAFIDGRSQGALPPSSSDRVKVSLDTTAISILGSGVHTADITWTNPVSGLGDIVLHAQVTLSSPGDPTGKPGPNNTGPSDEGALVPSGSITANVNGQVIENVSVTGTITILADNVTIRNFRINAGFGPYGIHALNGSYTDLLIEDGEIYNTSSSGILGKDFTARRLNIHESGGDGIKSRGNVLVEDCWIHHVGTIPTAHADGNQTRGGSNFVFRHNNIDMPISTSPNGQSGYLSNATFMIREGVGQIDNFLIEDNWLNGGNYTILLNNDTGGPSNMQIIGNRFGRDYRYGTIKLDGIAVTASGNVWDDNGLPMTWNN